MAEAEEAERETFVDIGDLYDAVSKRWRLFFPAMAIALGLAGAYIVLTPSRYAAYMSILVDPRERPPIGSDQAPPPQNSDAALVESQMRLITSTAVLGRVAAKERLALDPEFAPRPPSAIMTAIKAFLRIAPKSPDSAAGAIIEELSKRVTVKRAERSNVIDIELKASSREKARSIAQALADAYFEQQARMDDDVAERQSAWLDKRLSDLRTRVEAADRNIDDYRRARSFVVSDGRLTPEQQLKEANAALVEARGKRAEAEARWEQVRAALRGEGSIEALGESLRSPVVEKLRTQYSELSREDAYANLNLGPLHPAYRTIKAQMGAVKAQINAELKRISIATRRDLAAAKSAEAAASTLVSQLETSINNLGDRRSELNELERKAASLRTTYEKTLAARENIRKDIVASPNGVLINQPVADAARVAPRAMPALLVAAAGGVNIWVLTALGLEYLERRRRRRGPGESAEGLPRPAETAMSESGHGAPFVVTLPPPGPVEAMLYQREDICWRDAEALARRLMSKQNGAHATTIDRIGGALAQRFGNRAAAPVIAVASSNDAAAATILTLCLALDGGADGSDVLIFAREGDDPTLRQFVRGLQLAHGAGRERLPLFEYEAGGRGQGAILLAPFETDVVAAILDHEERPPFDMILVDLGALTELEGDDAVDAPLERVDGVVLAESDGDDLDRLGDLLAELGLDDRWLGVVDSPRAEARAQAS